MSQERISNNHEQTEQESVVSERERREYQAQVEQSLSEKLEQRSPEKGPDKQDQAAQEAIEQARNTETEHPTTGVETVRHERENHLPNSKERASAYNAVMEEVRSHMSPASRTFSKVIHAPAVEKTSDVVGGTIARPNAILAGGVSAFLISLIVYLVARYYGYPLSGTEAIAAFGFGWVLGVVFDFLRLMITGKRS